MRINVRKFALSVSLGTMLLAGLAWLAPAAEKTKPTKGADDAAAEIKQLKTRLAALEKRVDTLESRQSAFMGLHVDEDGTVKDNRGRKAGGDGDDYDKDN